MGLALIHQPTNTRVAFKKKFVRPTPSMVALFLFALVTLAGLSWVLVAFDPAANALWRNAQLQFGLGMQQFLIFTWMLIGMLAVFWPYIRKFIRRK